MADPPLNESNVRHLLRRTEFVDRTSRVDELLALGSMAAAVDDVLAVAPDPPSIAFTATSNWQRGLELSNFWLDQMVSARRPFAERMAFFWHGHFCSDLGKVNSAIQMREQIDLWRRSGLGNLRSLATTMSTQVAMIRYLDNNDNRASSPNQNFARELMELFLLGVGNYIEADVEASAAAWTGHTDQWDDDVSPYRWRGDWHDGRPKTYLGRPINASGTDPRLHGPETIDVVLGSGTVPAGADNVANRGRPTSEVAAEFLSRKLWSGFATGSAPPPDVMTTMRSALVGNNFEIRPWVRSMLLHPGFYTDAVKSALVRSPVEYSVALLYATGKTAAFVNFNWLMDGMGQQLLYPPNVSGWRPNGYWVNASAMEGRARTAQHFAWSTMRTYWQQGGAGVISLRGGSLTNTEVTARTSTGTPVLSNADFVSRLEQFMDLRLTPTSRAEVLRYANSVSVWDRSSAVFLMMAVPEMHLA